MSEVTNFRKNFKVALEYDGRSLNELHKDLGMSIAHLSRIRSGVKMENDKPITPTLLVCERIANSLGFRVRELLLPPSEFAKLAKARNELSSKSAK